MAGEGVQVRRVVTEEEGERDSRERVGVGVVGGACENHVDESAERKSREISYWTEECREDRVPEEDLDCAWIECLNGNCSVGLGGIAP